MFEIISSKKTDNHLKLVYSLNKPVNTNFLKMIELGVPNFIKFQRFDRLKNPRFRIKNSHLGVEVKGKLGVNYLYCVIENNHLESKELIEAAFENNA
ncbi:MAG: hypothetical protein GY816_14715 [Cytophagales bacterium]|nr:hypothetical protein [Cytophagales bacterium]